MCAPQHMNSLARGEFHSYIGDQEIKGETLVFAKSQTVGFQTDHMSSAADQNIGGVQAQATTATVLPMLRRV